MSQNPEPLRGANTITKKSKGKIMSAEKNGSQNQHKRHEGFAQDGFDTSKAKQLLETIQKSQSSQQKSTNKNNNK
ncbi:hypothetical protein ACE38U_08630 [Cedecea sp. S5-13]|uniref:hypothetical protein n=1 Tax=Cedecea selenatireducens TaxID=3144416 RepID=UPI0035CCEDB5